MEGLLPFCCWLGLKLQLFLGLFAKKRQNLSVELNPLEPWLPTPKHVDADVIPIL